MKLQDSGYLVSVFYFQRASPKGISLLKVHERPQQGAGNSASIYTVSYTHLTLPTKA